MEYIGNRQTAYSWICLQLWEHGSPRANWPKELRTIDDEWKALLQKMDALKQTVGHLLASSRREGRWV